jgi:Contractile injection system tube protein
MFDIGKITRMFIEAYGDPAFSDGPLAKGSGDAPTKFTLLVNPETYTRKYAIEYVDDRRANTANRGLYFRTKPEEFKIDVLFDGTGVVVDGGLLNIAIVNPFSSDDDNDVSSQITTLKNFCYTYSGDVHRPNYLKITWGDLGDTESGGIFKGVMTSMDIDYKLFRPDGKPIRAVAHLTLMSAIDPATAVRLEDPKSPDVTHQRVFTASDHFTLVANKVYEDLNYYIDVAKANKMLSFRKVAQGTKIKLPPIK